jgi:hypothetical protein
VHLVFKRGVGEAGLVRDLFIGQFPDKQIEVVIEQGRLRWHYDAGFLMLNAGSGIEL